MLSTDEESLRIEKLAFARDKSQCGGIHAITQPCWPRPIGKNMTKMGVAESALYLRAHHPVGNIFLFANVLVRDRLKKTRPSGAGVELTFGIK